MVVVDVVDFNVIDNLNVVHVRKVISGVPVRIVIFINQIVENLKPFVVTQLIREVEVYDNDY